MQVGRQQRRHVLRRSVAIATAGLVSLTLLSGCDPTLSPKSEIRDAAAGAAASPTRTKASAKSKASTAKPTTAKATSKAPATPTPAAKGTALSALAGIQVKGRAPKTGYTREQFGAAWADVDRNGCDTRNDILNRDLTDVSYRPGTHDCVVSAGTLNDPYTATRISFARGPKTSSAVQIDHVVALSDAWQKGAQQLTESSRRQLANDPLNLLAVDGPANMSKGDGDAATWLPTNKKFRCRYVARQVAVKARYQLWMTRAEHDAIAGILAGCPGEPLPSGGSAGTVEVTGTKSTSAAPTAKKTPKKTTQKAADVYYANCAAARAAGAAPVHRGDPGYSSRLDRDGDGVGCE